MSANPVIDARGVARVHQRGAREVEALAGASLRVEAGGFVALMGPSGSGKSTLLHILGLLDRPSRGRYRLLGRDASALDDDQRSERRARDIGFVFQGFHLDLGATALDNVLLAGLYRPEPGAVLRRRGMELLAHLGLDDRACFKPGRLSGGQQQRVALARALFNDPPLILADEPTGQLDRAASLRLLRLLQHLNDEGRTVVMATHDEEAAAHARRIVTLRDGRAVEDRPA
jgi:putative ABC transport system ATP-binding protein